MTSDTVGRGDLFACRRCGECCKGYGGTYITEFEIDDICRYLGLDRKRFMRNYCQISGGKPLVAQAENGYCIFWDQLCTIHVVKPDMCHKWPFIESILVDAGNWQSLAASCPGMRTDFSDDQIQKCVHDIIKKSC
ncbi:MAG: YkgJ family cysteine cluster protein [Desulfobacterales bacterium]|nr:YkgJ family cysteine cluster protein [Desulfobacterales bacterium]